MVSGLDQLPAFLSFLTKEILKPLNSAPKGIVEKASTVLIALDRPLFSLDIRFRKLMERNFIFPSGHHSHFLSPGLLLLSVASAILDRTLFKGFVDQI